MKPCSVEEVFFADVEMIPFCDCWIWVGSVTDRGYGIFKPYPYTRMYRAHRASYFFFNGAFPDELHVLHKCDTPLCVNPRHLFLGTHQENMADMKRKNRAKGAEGEANYGAKLKVEQVLEIRASELPYLALAKQYNVCIDTIERIVLRKSWKCLP